MKVRAAGASLAIALEFFVIRGIGAGAMGSGFGIPAAGVGILLWDIGGWFGSKLNR